MFLDGTLIVQIIHFWIAYLLLKYIFFKPAIAFLLEEENTLRNNRTIFLYKQDIIRQKEWENKEFWNQTQQQLQKELPDIKNLPVSNIPIQETVQIEPLPKQELIANLTNIVKERALHG